MQTKINFHTHTTFCDGNNSPEEMVQAAINCGMSALGFSGHAMVPFASDWHIAPREFQNYISEINSLKHKYSDKIQVFCGFEADFIPGFTKPDKEVYKSFSPDYLIGSVHYVQNERGFYTVDGPVEEVKFGVENLNNGNGKQAVCQYFEAQRQMLESSDFEIWGHPDLVRKRNGILQFFVENDSWYKEELNATVKSAQKAGIVAEINSGAIFRGAMNDFYPSEYFLQLLFDAGIPICINSDAHDVKGIDCKFEEAAARAKKIGYKELIYPVAGKNLTVKL